jgi:hypothetical protein
MMQVLQTTLEHGLGVCCGKLGLRTYEHYIPTSSGKNTFEQASSYLQT